MHAEQQPDERDDHRGDVEILCRSGCTCVPVPCRVPCGLFHVLDFGRTAAVDLLRQRRFHEWLKVAIEHVGRRAGGDARAQILQS